MPGIARLPDRAFVRAFQVIDGVIQNNQPIFMAIWVGSIPLLAVTAVWGAVRLDGVPRVLLMVAAAVYILGLQLPTFLFNIRLNNALQMVDADAADDATVNKARLVFERPWNRWNNVRSVMGLIASVLLLAVLLLVD
ncbi:MAG: DUF1772 domain-containing protein [Planctomycetota bacterium]